MELPTIRKARPDEAESISQVAILSKAHWGYTDEQMAVFAEELTLTPEMIEPRRTQVLEIYAAVAGFYTLLAQDDGSQDDGSIELEHLFILPTQLRKGFGKLLFDHATDAAKNLGFTRMVIQSDPNAEGFYAALGAKLVKYISSSIPGRKIPFFEVELVN